MSNPYLSLTELASLESLNDDNQMMVIVSPSEESEQGTTTSVGYVSLSDFRDSYLLTTVNEQITALQNKPGNGAFASPVTMTVSGVVTGSTTFDGSANFSLDLTMPDNSIPISAVEDLASTIATLQSDADQPDLLAVSYYSDFNATQTSVLGYWNADTANTTGNDSTGTLLELSSNGTPAAASNAYVNQLCFGNNGTLGWRRNVDNSGWSIVTLWHSGNFTPSDYVESGSTPTFGDYIRVTDGTNVLWFQTEPLSIADSVGMVTAQNVPMYLGVDGTWQLEITATGLTVQGGNLTLPNGNGLVWAGGAELITGAGGATISVQGGSGGNIFGLNTSGGSEVVVWDGSGNMSASANITSTGTMKSGTGIMTSGLAIGTSNAPGTTLDIYLSSGRVLVEALSGVNAIASVNTANSAYQSMVLENAGLTQSSNMTVDGLLTVTSGISATGSFTLTGPATINSGNTATGLNLYTGYGQLIARGASGINYWDSANTANSAYQAMQINCAGLTIAGGGLTVSGGSLTASAGLTVNNDPLYSTQGVFVSQFGSLAFSHGQGTYIGWNYSGGQGETDFVNNEGGGTSVTNIMQLSGAGALTTTGVANFNTSDRRLKTNLKKIRPNVYHRVAPLYSYNRIDTGLYGESPLAQHIQKVNPQRVSEYHHMDTKARRHKKRLAVDLVGVALEQSYWASYEVDDVREEVVDLQKLVVKLQKRIDKLEAQNRKK
jgi:hypothetical protein